MHSSIQQYLKEYFSNRSIQFISVGGGCINNCFQITIGSEKFFLKVNSATRYPKLFEKEKSGLELLANQNIIRVPKPLLYDEIDDKQILLLEWIETGPRTEKFWRNFGELLAQLHDITQNYFGLDEDNYMGSLPQTNSQHQNWNEFFIHCRLQPQIKLADEKHLLQTKHLAAFEKLYLTLPGIFTEKKPSLLHGDLWSGNFMCDENSQPVLIDPAVYYGHRSIDLAMTTLFGGFDREFYDVYYYHSPFPKNYREQWDVANLYPLLVHLNLFGNSYLSQIENILKKWN